MSGINILDYGIILIFVGSMLAGLVRGVIKEVISLVTWVAAFFVASMFGKPLSDVMIGSSAVQSMVATLSSSFDASYSVSLITLGLSFLVLFVGTMIVGSIVSYILSSAVSAVGVGFANRILGGAFGFARGYLITLVILFLITLTPLTAQSWWTGSSFGPNFMPAIEWLGNKIQPGIDTLKSSMGGSFDDINTKVKSGFDSLYQAAQPNSR